MALGGSLRAWYGERIVAKAERAAQAAIDETCAACVAFAVPRAPYKTGFLRASAFVVPARRTASGIVGRWGFSAAYAAYLEFGTVHMTPRPFMRPAMDAMYPLLGARLRAHFRGS